MEFSYFKQNNIGMFFLLTTLIFVTSHHHIQSASAARDPAAKTNTDFIKTSCVATTYPELCFSSLSVHASAIQSSPQLMAGTALTVSLTSAEATSEALKRMSRRGLRPREAAAMRDCLEELDDTVDELRKSAAEMGKMVKGNPNFALMINDIQTWVSAALTDESTCTDGFDDKSMNGDVKTAVRAQIVNVAQLTSNALALINKYATIHG